MKKFNWMFIPFLISVVCVLIATIQFWCNISFTNLAWMLVWDSSFAFTFWKVVHPEDVLVIDLCDGKELDREREKLLKQIGKDQQSAREKIESKLT
ncbi:MAG: hypothetical protein UT24_C0030G0014 [Candidatus Woesebacteria bacterium GW2011_GWB1_39_12]|uniref:Uncharacterized protein n=1 Tax=Candidatus Woesebacteria bacterium GW2011_GWB1_39_12 TaxID=1618574 RepID=A0A0G0QB53_9BACT|nr:MAG: hypothetical protein UT24_C0030G0014 [Candidatus Woesebacteria bacterium GW2011_GWB1_39_12]